MPDFHIIVMGCQTRHLMGCQVLSGNPRNFTPPLLSHCVSGTLTELRSALGFFFWFLFSPP